MRPVAEVGVARHPAWLVGAAALVAAALAARGLDAQLPAALWGRVLLHPDLDDAQQLLVAYSFLPRVAVSLLSGAALALAGTIFQQVMRNPLAEPTTLGVSAGASVTLTLALAFAPGLLAYGREWIAFIGAAGAILAVFGLAWTRALAPFALVLAGMIVGLYCGAAAAAVQLFENPYMESFYLWGVGSLSQQDWSVVLYLLPRLILAMSVTAAMLRPLTLLGLEDDGARSMGISLFAVRLIGLAVAVALSAFVVAAVGVIGFIGLAGPALVRLAGARRFASQLLWSPLLGAGLLCLTDQLVQWVSAGGEELVPTGAATALLGIPLLLWMLPRLQASAEPLSATRHAFIRRSRRPWGTVLIGLAVLSALAVVSLHLGQDGHGWRWSEGAHLESLMRWRAPRLFGAMAAGAMLATAGALMQRMTGNPMAAPEILGISSGAALGLILLVMFSSGESRLLQLGACTLGAFGTFALILLLGRRAVYAPDRILLAGIAIGAVANVLLLIFMASGSDRISALQTWMAGATDLVTPQEALFASIAAALLLALALLVQRWLDLLQLGAETPCALGVDLGQARLVILLLTALLTAGATLTVGPLGFVGLMGPHLARLSGLQRPLAHLAGSAALGALIMVAADWLGRTVLFPYQVPAGLIATLIGGPYLMALLRRRPA
jgi:iron complex transport system permease protein